MKIGYFVDSFDPITNKHIEYAKKLIKDNQLSALFFVVDGEGISDKNLREKMVLRAIHPYRKFKALLKGFDSNEQDIVFMEKSLLESSKQVREGDFSLLCYANKRYIMDNGLYVDSMIKSLLYEKRYIHSVSVAKLSKEIADSNGLDSKKAYLIGMLHDIVKKWDEETMFQYISIYKPYEINEPFPVWHQFVGAHLLKSKYKLSDKKMIKAIRHHCLGDDNDVYSKIIFIADKLDPSRGYDSSKQIEASLKDVSKGFEIVKKQNEEYLRKTGVKS